MEFILKYSGTHSCRENGQWAERPLFKSPFLVRLHIVIIIINNTFSSIYFYFQNFIIIESHHLSLLFPPSKPSHIPTLLFFKFMSFFINCCYVHTCICMYIYVPKYNLPSLYDGTHMYVCFQERLWC